ncbi:hypothetical protein [Rhizorhabdus dicambivorans]|uniref:Uncharacterized protein n=1 Tax=Rhizorhabdus dicambivorans TaxID=1850238 RepID=A0A2A4FS67_9SPHN|nr:hypothetical protein [Rhizorhabdus dicambivorans]ATE65647.1 hypothetical protein CMV14_15570 [Rhizorhabdus dicambivorans]PCE40989.1 hypothetical protein COO09_17480 [Rhizorhabdus dicambivorans]
MPSDQDLAAFIRSTFRSVWSLELVSLMAREGDRGWERAELVAALRASDLIVDRAIDELTIAGVLLLDGAGQACLRPASADLKALVDASTAFYVRSPDKVRRIIITGATTGLTAFADAFRIRKD